jgi:hypothetical protein
MLCASCGQRKGRRECPALGRTICTVCCGTKRLVEIRCPTHCTYLAAAREHPPAVVRRQQERDVARLLPTIRQLTERQYQLFFLFHTAIARHKPGGSIADDLMRLVDADIADAAAALASTLETAARGVIYEHTPQSLPAQSLAAALGTTLTQIREQGARVYDGEAALALRAIEEGARMARAVDEGETAYLDLMSRLLRVAGTAEVPQSEPPAASSLIIP